jgi:hypothetical protein
MNEFPWTIFFILLAAGFIGSVAVLPYALSMNPKAMEMLKGNTPESGRPGSGEKKLPPTPVLILLSIVQSLVLVGLSTFLGLLAARQVGLEVPILQALIEGRPVMEKNLEMAPAIILLGLVSGILILALEWYYFLPRIPRKLAKFDAGAAFWKRALACFYGGIVEEILLRLFLMSVLVWLIGLVWKSSDGAPALGAFWLANILAAVLFGAGHLPATSQLVKLTPMVVARALLLNGIPGVAFGYLYMTYGLEAAMLSHFSLDILLHLIAPPFSRRFADSLPPEPVAELT